MIYNTNVYSRTLRGIVGLLTIAGLLTLNDIVFLVWRSDKPHGNPGGPLAGMGGWVLLWECTCNVSGVIIAPCVFKAVRGIRERAKSDKTCNTGAAARP